jgi:hypothetical protein
MKKEREFAIGGEIEISGKVMPGADGQHEVQEITSCSLFMGSLGNSLQIELGDFKNNAGHSLCDVLHGEHYYKILSLLAKQDQDDAQ